MRSYRRYEDVVKQVKSMITEQIRNSSYFLPGEIVLAEKIGTSRMTLRKALTQVEQEGLIRRDRMRTEITSRRDVLAGCGKILFVALAHHSTFLYQAIERLWIKFGPEVFARGGNLELFAVNRTTSPEEWQEKISTANVIFLTDEVSDVINRLLANSSCKPIIFSLLETIPAPNSIYLDNYSAGYLAAQTLIKAGCRKVIGISFDYRVFHNEIFPKRIRGFSDGLRDAGLLNPETIKLIPYPSAGSFNPEVGDNYSRTARQTLEQAYAEGCDGAFIISDEEIGSITMNLFRQNVIPAKLKLITLNGVGDAMRHNPPISCINHATAEVVDAAIEQLRLIAEKRFTAPVVIAIKPGVYINQTLGLETEPKF